MLNTILLAALLALCAVLLMFTIQPASSATTQPRYYAHGAVHDKHGVIAPWYAGLNGQCDLRVRIAAETLKRFPWTDTSNAVAAYPHYVFTSLWQIDAQGNITPKNPGDWMNGDLGQRATSTLIGFSDYYRYTGDPAAIAHLTYMANFLLDHCLTPPDHPYPDFFISVPVKGKAYGKCDPHGMIQLDLCASVGYALLRAHQVTGNTRWFEMAKHWGDVFAEKCNRAPGADPWGRYANPEDSPWKDNKQTGGVTMILSFLDELIRLDYTGKNNSIVAARDAGRQYLRDKLLPAWAVDDTWGRYFWDWANPTQNCLTTPDAAHYILENKDEFPNWRNDVRNILTLFLNRTSVNPESNGDVYSGAWAYPESSSCCGRSLWYAPLCVAPTLAQYGVQADSAWCRELAYRQMVLQAYDVHETGVTEDNIDGGIIVNGSWLNIAHPLPLRFVLSAIAWLPEELGASRENHIVRSTAVMNSVVYGKGRIEYSTFDAPTETIGVLRLAFAPKSVTADGRSLKQRRDLKSNGYTVKRLPNGDAIVSIRHDGAKRVSVTGDDPQQVIDDNALIFEGDWKKETVGNGLRAVPLRVAEASGAAVTARFEGNQVRLIGCADEFGGLADVYVDGVKQLVHIDCWNPTARSQQVLYYKNGLSQDAHTLKVVARGAKNPYSKGTKVYVDAVQFSSADGRHNFPSGTGPKETQRMVFGTTRREDYKDSQGNLWRPGTEFVIRSGAGKDSVAESWWTTPAPGDITNTPDPELYRYGVHGKEFWVNVTVALTSCRQPAGRMPAPHYYVRLKFAATRGMDAKKSFFSIKINGELVVKNFDVAATAGGANRAIDLVFNNVAPRNGIIEIRFTGARVQEGETVTQSEAFVQAVVVGPGDGGKGAAPVSATIPEPRGNLLMNPGFEETVAGVVGNRGTRTSAAGWTYEFLGSMQSYVWQEQDYKIHPDWGLPEFHSGKGAIRTHTDGDGHTRIYQDVEVKPNTKYTASVWARAADLRGKGFGKDARDSAGLVIQELDTKGNVIGEHKKVEVKTATPYTRLNHRFTTGKSTASVRFVLDTVIRCHYAEGHVTYDDGSLIADALTRPSG